VIVERFNQTEWRELSSEAHMACFAETRPNSVDRIDFALMTADEVGPIAYMTLREIDSETVYLQYGGSFRPNSVSSFRSYTIMLNRLKELGYKAGLTYIENTNTAMLKFALKVGWLITGVRTYKGLVLTEQSLNIENLNV
jgi:hypothetical protein